MTWDVIDKINRPSHVRRAIWFFGTFFSTSQASPNDTAIIVIVIIVTITIGEAKFLVHDGGIILQSTPSRVDSTKRKDKPSEMEMFGRRSRLTVEKEAESL